MNTPSPPHALLIIVAEDDPDDRLLIEDAVAEADLGIRIECVCDGIELQERLLANANGERPDLPRPDLVLLDLNMPRMDGREVLEWIKIESDFREVPVVILSTSNNPDDVRFTKVLGAADFLTKPDSFDGLVALVRSLPEYWRQSRTTAEDASGAASGGSQQ